MITLSYSCSRVLSDHHKFVVLFLATNLKYIAIEQHTNTSVTMHAWLVNLLVFLQSFERNITEISCIKNCVATDITYQLCT